MVEVGINELKIDEQVLKYATDTELIALKDIVKAIVKRTQEQETAE